MKPLGHVAVGWLAGTAARPDLRWGGAVAVFGALLPDLVDKTAEALRWTLWSRWYGHALIVWIGVALLWQVLRIGGVRGATVVGWLLAGGLSHLLADVVGDLLVGVFRTGVLASAWPLWPFVTVGQLDLTWMGPPLPWRWGPEVVEGAVVAVVGLVVARLVWLRTHSTG